MGTPRHIHLIGICGTAMASLAGMLRQRGFQVTGSDAAVYPPMSEFLAGLGISVAQPYADKNLEPRPDVVIVGNAISRGNPELERALDEHIPLQSLAQAVGEEFLRGHQTVVVAGTHGKTTTSSMLSWIFQVAGRKPSFLVGGIAENFGSSFKLDEGHEFIIEGDEYDTAFFDKGAKFLHYFPDAVLLTSVEFDHADIYKDLEAVKIAFQRLVNLVPRQGKIVAWDGKFSSEVSADRSQAATDANVDECVARAFCPVERYGFAEESHWRAMKVQYEGLRTTWRVLRAGTLWAELEFALAGEYNVLNATGAAAMAAAHGISSSAVAEALRTFKSVKRRLEVVAEVNGVTIIDDFAHHPTAIAQTLRALRTRYRGRRLWAILEPRSNTLRRNVFQRNLAESLALADRVAIAAIYKPELIAESQRLNPAAIIQDLQRRRISARQFPNADAIVAAITPELLPGDVVAILSNGGFGGIYEKLPRSLMKSGGVASKA